MFSGAYIIGKKFFPKGKNLGEILEKRGKNRYNKVDCGKALAEEEIFPIFRGIFGFIH